MSPARKTSVPVEKRSKGKVTPSKSRSSSVRRSKDDLSVSAAVDQSPPKKGHSDSLSKSTKNPRQSTGRLGRGLSALFSASDLGTEDSLLHKEETPQGTTTGVFREIEVAAISAQPGQPRSHFDEAALEELAASIKQVGIIQPIIVHERPSESKDSNKRGGKIQYALIAGERRLRAAKMAGLLVVPAFVERKGDEQTFEKMLIENIQREDLSPLEEAKAYATLMKTRGLKQEQLAELVGKSRSHIANLLRLLKLPGSVQSLLETRKLTFGAARALIGLPAEQLTPLLAKLEQQHLSVREIEKYVDRATKKISAAAPPLAKSSETDDTAATRDKRLLREIEEEIRVNLGTQVTLTPLKKNKGKLEIEYYSYEHLEELKRKLQ